MSRPNCIKEKSLETPFLSPFVFCTSFVLFEIQVAEFINSGINRAVLISITLCVFLHLKLQSL